MPLADELDPDAFDAELKSSFEVGGGGDVGLRGLVMVFDRVNSANRSAKFAGEPTVSNCREPEKKSFKAVPLGEKTPALRPFGDDILLPV